MAPVILFDLPSKGRNACWSLNPWKTRLVLNYKNIEYETQWLEYPDVAPTLKATGLPPNETTPFPYTIPAIRLPDGQHVMDSLKIVRELEKRYPEPSLHLDAEVVSQISKLIPATSSAMGPAVLAPIPRVILSEKGAAYFNRTRKDLFGVTLDQLEKEKSDAAWDAGKQKLDELAALLKQTSGPYFLGHTDFVAVAFLQFTKRLESDIFDRILAHDKAFVDLYEACAEWLERDYH